MNPADLPPKPLPSGEMWHSPSGPVSPAHPRRSEIAPCQSRDGTLPSAVPAPSFDDLRASGDAQAARQEVVASLRASIRRIERGNTRSPFAMREWQHMAAGPVAVTRVPALRNGRGNDETGNGWSQSHWTLGVPEIDQWIGGLDEAGVHEIKPKLPGSGVPAAMGMAAAFIFALRLAARRVSGEAGRREGAAGHASQSGVILLCMPSRDRLELGRLYGPGLAGLGFDARQFLIVETAKAADTLWAMEEGLRSEVPAIVIGCLDELPLTPARRLSLAADQHLTPCIAVTGARTPGAGATATRWRIGAARSGANPLDPCSPGPASCVAALERCRHRAGAGDREAFTLDWCDETFRFRLAAEVADRETAARAAGAGV